jgi:hypothetical protein
MVIIFTTIIQYFAILFSAEASKASDLYFTFQAIKSLNIFLEYTYTKYKYFFLSNSFQFFLS